MIVGGGIGSVLKIRTCLSRSVRKEYTANCDPIESPSGLICAEIAKLLC